MAFVPWPRIILQLGRKRWRVLQCTILVELDLNLTCEGIWSPSELAWESRHSPLVCDYVHMPKCTNVHFMLTGSIVQFRKNPSLFSEILIILRHFRVKYGNTCLRTALCELILSRINDDHFPANFLLTGEHRRVEAKRVRLKRTLRKRNDLDRE